MNEQTGWLASRSIARACEAGFGDRVTRREGPNHITSPFGVADVSHNAPPALVVAMLNAAAAVYGASRELAA